MERGGGGKIMHRRTNQVRQFTEHCLLVTDVHLLCKDLYGFTHNIFTSNMF